MNILQDITKYKLIVSDEYIKLGDQFSKVFSYYEVFK